MTNFNNGIDQQWWKELIVYQIYPRSFLDTSGNGVGDLRGIIDKLDYIKSLGVNAVWINPFYESPNDDNGYDISDYRKILAEFGSMADFDELIAGMHARDIKFVMDVVVNHTSDEHEWFVQSRSSRDNPYRDYYHWWPAEKGVPPHRFSYFDDRGSAWAYDEQTDAYYLHYFSKKQPDLNWENPAVRREVFDIMNFWAEKGVDGFRLDAFQFISKDTTFPEFPENYDKDVVGVIKYHGMGPTLHQHIRELHDEVLAKHQVFAVSEGAGSSFEDAHDLVDPERNELQMVYHFEGVDLGNDIDNRYTLAEFRDIHSRWDAAFAQKGWLSIFLANHDLPRMLSKFGDDRPQFRDASAKLLNTFLMTMRGTTYCYFGDEIGMSNIYFETIEEYRDIAAINGYKKALSKGQDMEKFMANLREFSRDNSRTPMQWSSEPNAGFSSAEPWIPVNNNFTHVNVALQEQDEQSVLNHFRRLTHLRHAEKTLIYGDYQLLVPDHSQLYAYRRSDEQSQFTIVMNFSDHSCDIALPELGLDEQTISQATIAANNLVEFHLIDGNVQLAAYQALVIKH